MTTPGMTPEWLGRDREAPMDVEARFWKLVGDANRLDAEANRLLDESDRLVDSCAMVEPAFVAIVELVNKHPDSRDVFVRCFSEIVLWKHDAPWMLVPFCMRALRMPEIKNLIHRDGAEHRGTAYYASRMNYWSSVMYAYRDDVWREGEGFNYFAGERRGR